MSLMRENETGLFGIQWHITDDCDQRCRHCYIFAEDNDRHLDSMDFQKMKETVERVEAFLKPKDMVPNWIISGGDPLLNADFWKLSELFKEKGQSFVILGNPFHLTADVCRRLKDSGCTGYQMSIDGTESTHDFIRMPGSFKKTLEALKLLHDAGINTLLSMTVSESNYKELPDVMDIAEKAGVDCFGFARYVPTSGEKENTILPLEYRALLETYVKKRREAKLRGSNTFFALKEHLLVLYLYEEGLFLHKDYCHKEGNPMPYGCHCANDNLTVCADGTVMACRRLESSVLGNIFEDSLSSMWDEAKERYRHYERFSDCSRCKIEPWCRGCPAVSASLTGDFYGRDPQCWHVIEE